VLGPFSECSTDVLYVGPIFWDEHSAENPLGDCFKLQEVKVELVDVDVVVRMKRDCICKVDVGCEWVQSGRSRWTL
jgi:hypothetical protein